VVTFPGYENETDYFDAWYPNRGERFSKCGMMAPAERIVKLVERVFTLPLI